MSAVNAFGADGWRERWESGGTIFGYSFDPQGTLVARGTYQSPAIAIIDQSVYDAYGNMRADFRRTDGNETTHKDPVGFEGQYGYYAEYDAPVFTSTTVGSVPHYISLLTHRYYSPSTGEFINRDPIGTAGGENLYGYAGDNPVNRVDPSGDGYEPIDEFIDALTTADDIGNLIGDAAFGEEGASLKGDWMTLGLDGAGLIPGVPPGAGRVARLIKGAEHSVTAAKDIERVASKGWAKGDDIYKLTKKGTEPAVSTVRARFWKNEADGAAKTGEQTEENIARMRKGFAPQRYNKAKKGMEAMELSHEPIPMRQGGKDIVPRWPQEHAEIDSQRRPGY